VSGATANQLGLKLTVVARAIVEELRLDCEDYLRHYGPSLWKRSDPRRHALAARRCGSAEEVERWVRTYGLDRPTGPDKGTERSISSNSSIPSIDRRSWSVAGTRANAALELIGVAAALLDRRIAAQATTFETQGGFTERLDRTCRARQPDRDTRVERPFRP
jgi:four helix bundle suffix protein